MGWSKYTIPGVLRGGKPKFVVMKDATVIDGSETLEGAQKIFRDAAEKFFGESLEKFFQGCADDFNSDYKADDPGHPHYTGAELLSDKLDAYQTISNHGFEIARHVRGNEYIADDATRTL